MGVLRLPRYIDAQLSYADRFPVCTGPSPGGPRARFLIIMDFEATCDFGPQPRITPETSEIIEFPWVVLDTTTMEIVHEEQIYVQPQDMQGITEYCQKLTGISPAQCQQGVSLAQAMESFTHFMESKILPFGENSFQIVTDGVWDLEAQLAHETRRKSIPLPTWFTRYFDLRQEFRQFYSWFPFPAHAPSLQLMLNAYSLRVIGRQHSGLDDCKTIAQIVKVLLQLHPNTFNHPKEIPKDHDPTSSMVKYAFSSRCPPGSWQCSRESCAVWNQPYVHSCKFCEQSR